jgi:two-component system response regulator PilR (NtrC family)
LKTGSIQKDGDRESSRTLHILLVEDHDDTRRAMELFLEALGHRPQAASGVNRALDLAASSDSGFDLLLSDVRLPDGNGWDLLRRLERAGCRPEQAIAISAWAGEDNIAESKRAGFLTHLTKPIAPQVLKAALAQAAELVFAKKRSDKKASG